MPYLRCLTKGIVEHSWKLEWPSTWQELLPSVLQEGREKEHDLM